MDRLELSRYRDKTPAAKVAVESQKVRSKVEKSDTKRRQKMKVDDPRNLRLAELDREIEAKNRRERGMTHANEIRNDAVRLSRAEALNDRADEYMRAHGISDYGTALSAVVKLSDNGQSEPSVAEVERFATENGTDFGTALRSILQDGQDHAQAFGSTGSAATSAEDENAELQKVLKARGYDS